MPQVTACATNGQCCSGMSAMQRAQPGHSRSVHKGKCQHEPSQQPSGWLPSAHGPHASACQLYWPCSGCQVRAAGMRNSVDGRRGLRPATMRCALLTCMPVALIAAAAVLLMCADAEKTRVWRVASVAYKASDWEHCQHAAASSVHCTANCTQQCLSGVAPGAALSSQPAGLSAGSGGANAACN